LSEIIIEEPIIEKKRFTSKVNVPGDLEKYLKNDELFVEYDTGFHADESIVNTALTATVLPLAWLTGNDIKVRTLDEAFKNSMDELKLIFKDIHRLIPFTTNILTGKLVKNKIMVSNPKRSTGLLFSGGIDSTYSMISNLHQKPKLIMYWGIDNFPYPENSEQWRHIYSTYSEQAKRLDLDIHLVKTNISQILDTKRINHDFHKILQNGSVRAMIQHSLILLPLVAPLSITRFNKLLIASSGEQSFNYESPWGSTPRIDEIITWADLRVSHDGNIPRANKIAGEMKEFLLENQLLLRVCLRKLEKNQLNDSSCEKCLRTIASLVLAGIDPNVCGFNVDNSTFRLMKEMLTNTRVTNDLVSEWLPIQKLIPARIDFDIYGSKEFYEWFRGFEFTLKDRVGLLRDLYYNLPYEVAKNLDMVYRKAGVKVQEASPKRDNFK
jgi:hypothetical protein